MRVLLINQYYHPDIAATAQLCSDLCEDLVARGHAVTVLCGSGRYRTPHHGRAAEELPPLPSRAVHRGVDIVRVAVPGADAAEGAAGLSLPQRALGYAGFGLAAAAALLRLPRPDVVLALSTPPLVAALGLLAQARFRTRFVYWVQDIYPELAVALAVLPRRGPVTTALGALARQLYRRADALVALDEAMAARLTAAGAPAARLHVIDHFADCRELTPRPPDDSALRRSLGLTGEFVVCYAGNLGRGHDFDTVAAALAQQAAAAPEPLHWLFVGEGAQKAALQARVPRALAAQVHFAPPQARELLADVLAAGDVGLITLAAELEGLMAPSKLYGLLAAGRPVVYVGPPRGRIPELLAAEPVGAAVANGDGGGLLAAVRALRDDPARRQQAGLRARQLAETRYDRRLATARHAALLEAVVGGRA